MLLISNIDTIEDVIAHIEDELDLTDDLTLNILTLDDNWLTQPTISFRWNQITNIAEHCLKNMERKHKEQAAELYLAIKREHLENNTKITETALANEVAATQTIKDLQSDICDAQYIVSLLITTKKAVDDRRRSLDGLTSLYTSNYFQNQTDAPALKELGDAKYEEEQHVALNKSDKLKRLLKKRKKE